MSTLNELIAQVALELRDPDHATWSADELTAHLRRALRAYSLAAPRRLETLLTPAAGEREISLSSLAGLLEVTDVWYPWDAEDQPATPPRPAWSLPADGLLRLEVAETPTGEDAARVFYTALHTIADLDEAEATTLDAQGEGLVVLGASAHAAEQAAQALIGAVTISGRTPEQLIHWATERRRAFEAGLEALQRRTILAQDARAVWRADDRQDGRGGVV